MIARAWMRLLMAAAGAVSAAMVASAWALPDRDGPEVAKKTTLAGSGKQDRRVRPAPLVSQFMVKFRSEAAAHKLAGVSQASLEALSHSAGVRLQSVRPMSGGLRVLAMPSAVSAEQAQAIAQRLSADPQVLIAEPDMPIWPAATPPDADFSTRQWHLQTPGGNFTSASISGGASKLFANAGGGDFQTAWDSSTGQNTVRVALIDTGVALTHPDLAPAIIAGSGYDFVSSNVGSLPANFTANDGNGRDADPTDPGDWITAAEKASYSQCDDGASGDTSSSWHGTHMAGLLAAQWGASATAGTAAAGGAPGARIVPIRVLGKCGGATSDLIDAMRWAAGLAIADTSVPANAYPAQVINLSLGGGSCGTLMQQAINEILAAGVSIVAATGNDGLANTLIAPAACAGVISVTSHVINGENADYSNVGSATVMSAAGGGDGTVLTVSQLTTSDVAYYVWSTGLYGRTDPASTAANGLTGPHVQGLTGTSPAAPHVSATAALMLSMDPTLTPSQVQAYLRSTARPHPAGGYCELRVNTCGAGLLDAGRAVGAVASAAPVPNAGLDQRVVAGGHVALSGSATAVGGKTISSYLWSVESGAAVTLVGATNAHASFTALAPGQRVLLRLTVTDSASVSAHDFALVRVNTAPTLSPRSALGTAGLSLSLTLQGSDAEVDSLTYALASGSSLPTGATLTSAGVVSWPSPTVGTHTFNVQVSDGLEQSSPAQITLVITEPPSKSGALSPWLLLGLLAWPMVTAMNAAKRRRAQRVRRD